VAQHSVIAGNDEVWPMRGDRLSQAFDRRFWPVHECAGGSARPVNGMLCSRDSASLESSLAERPAKADDIRPEQRARNQHFWH
jgi:hypothetical protein